MSAEDFSDGVAKVKQESGYNTKFGVMDKTGAMIVPFGNDFSISDFSDGLARAFKKVKLEFELSYANRRFEI